MRKLFACLILAVAFSCTPAARQQIAAEGLSDLAKSGLCVLSAIAEGGLDDPKVILTKCGGSTLQQIEELTGEWLAQTTVTDAAPAAQVSPLHARFALVHQRAAGDAQ